MKSFAVVSRIASNGKKCGAKDLASRPASHPHGLLSGSARSRKFAQIIDINVPENVVVTGLL